LCFIQLTWGEGFAAPEKHGFIRNFFPVAEILPKYVLARNGEIDNIDNDRIDELRLLFGKFARRKTLFHHRLFLRIINARFLDDLQKAVASQLFKRFFQMLGRWAMLPAKIRFTAYRGARVAVLKEIRIMKNLFKTGSIKMRFVFATFGDIKNHLLKNFFIKFFLHGIASSWHCFIEF
jgi:hypothetical protein